MAAVWTAIPGTYNSVKGVMAGTDAAPASQALDGVLLNGVGSVTVWLEADVGQTLTGSGTLLGYRSDLPLLDWAWAPDYILTVPATAAGNRRLAFLDLVINNPRGRLAHIANTVGLTGGGLTLYYTCTMLKGFGA